MPPERRQPLRDTLKYLVFVLPLVAVGLGGYVIYRHFTEKDRIIEEQRRIIGELGVKLDRAWDTELVADVRVDRIATDPAGGKHMELTFVQYQRDTEIPVMRRSFVLPGEELYIDALVVQFERPLVDEGDGLRGKSVFVFRRAFGDKQRPVDGVPLYRSQGDGVVPEVAQVDGTPSTYETELWAKFWTYANDPKAAAAAGIRVAQGEAPHVKAQAGQVYQLTLRSSGGLEIKPRLPSAVVGDTPPAGSANTPKAP
jgi:hypothetical protein